MYRRSRACTDLLTSADPCAYIYLHACTNIHTQTNRYDRTNVHTHADPYLHARAHVHTQTDRHASIYLHPCADRYA